MRALICCVALMLGCATPRIAARYDRPLTVKCFDGTTRRGTAVVPARCGLWTPEACGGVSEGVESLSGQYVLVGKRPDDHPLRTRGDELKMIHSAKGDL